VAECLNNLASALPDQGRRGEAEKLYREAIEIARQTGREQHRETAIWLCNLGTVLAETGRRAESVEAYRRAVEIFSHGPVANHPLHANALVLLAGALMAEGKLAEAAPLVARSTHIFRQCFGEASGSGANLLNSVAKALERMGSINEAEALLQTGVDCYSRDVVLLGNLAFLKLHARRDIVLALELFHRACQIKPDDTVNLANLASVHLLRNDPDQCAQVLERAWSLARPNPDCFSGRILFLRVLLAMSRGEDSSLFLGQLKLLPAIGAVNWPCTQILEWIDNRLDESQATLLRYLHGTNDGQIGSIQTSKAALRWHAQATVPLSVTWPKCQELV
jgi:tetratricopeptide (TPR) repeat protein